MESKAYAKINLTLDIVGRREDGFHLLDSVMQSVSLFDTVDVSLNESGAVRLACDAPGVPTDEKNTAFRAARFFLDAAGLPFGADIRIEKRIPSEAGLGGGSADAAAVLRALNRLTEEAGEEPLPLGALLYLGMRVGADVPFCILNGTQRCGGIGEQMVPLAPLSDCGIVILKPEAGVSTPEAYRAADAAPDGGRRYTPALVRALERRSLEDAAQALGNRFEDALRIPECTAARDALLAEGALGAAMTGSGSAVFGIFPATQDAEQALEALQSRWPRAFAVTPVGSAEGGRETARGRNF